MSKGMFVRAILWLTVIFTGIAFGAGMYEARVEVPQWLTTESSGLVWHAVAAKAADPGLRFWAFVTTGPVTLLTLAGLAMVWGQLGAVKKWWLIVLGLLLVDRVLTFGYFIPTMVELMGGNMPQAEAVKTAQMWADLNLVRLTASGLAFLASLKVLTIWYSTKTKS